MSAEAISNALFLIAAVICAAVLIVAIFPAIFTMAGTFGSASHAADLNIRTDFKIVLATNTGTTVSVWMKNIGSAQIPLADIEQRSDVFLGPEGSGVQRFSYGGQSYTLGQWTDDTSGLSGNGYWNPGETLGVNIALPSSMTNMDPSTTEMYFQFVLPNGVSRSVTFTQTYS
jgi:hypothetical protein